MKLKTVLLKLDRDVEFWATSGKEAQYFGPRTFIHLARKFVREKGIKYAFIVCRLNVFSVIKSLAVKKRLHTCRIYAHIYKQMTQYNEFKPDNFNTVSSLYMGDVWLK